MDLNALQKKALEYYALFVKTCKEDPAFVVVTFLSYLTCCFSITGLTGGWANYDTVIRGVPSSAKVGLFNSYSSLNGQWKTYFYSACVAGDKNAGQLTVCEARLSIGIVLCISIALSLAAAVVLTIMCTKTLLDYRMKQAKYLVMVLTAICFVAHIFAIYSGTVNIGQIVTANPKISNYYYGVGYVFTIVNLILYLLICPSVYFLVSKDGRIQTLPRLASDQKKFTDEPAYY